MVSVWRFWFFENCIAATRAPDIAALILDDFSTTDAFESRKDAERDPGFKEKGSLGVGSGNFTGAGLSTGTGPLTAASYIYYIYFNQYQFKEKWESGITSS